MAVRIDWPKSLPARHDAADGRIVRLRLDRPFLTDLDEETFLSWLKSIHHVAIVDRDETYVEISVSHQISVGSTVELLALTVRFDVDATDLRFLAAGPHATWIQDPHAFWFEQLFGERNGMPRRVS